MRVDEQRKEFPRPGKDGDAIMDKSSPSSGTSTSGREEIKINELFRKN